MIDPLYIIIIALMAIGFFHLNGKINGLKQDLVKEGVVND